MKASKFIAKNSTKIISKHIPLSEVIDMQQEFTKRARLLLLLLMTFVVLHAILMAIFFFSDTHINVVQFVLGESVTVLVIAGILFIRTFHTPLFTWCPDERHEVQISNIRNVTNREMVELHHLCQANATAAKYIKKVIAGPRKVMNFDLHYIRKLN